MIDITNSLILVVDDVPDNIRLLENVLKRNGFKFEFATNGNEALEWTKNRRFDLILLDVMMPKMNGYEVCKALKSYTHSKDIPVIFLTAKTDTESVIAGFNAGGVDYISKPFNQKELLARVQTHIKLNRAYSEIQYLRGILPICSYCKKIRNDSGYWEQLETYFSKYTDTQFSHGICPDCLQKVSIQTPKTEE